MIDRKLFGKLQKYHILIFIFTAILAVLGMLFFRNNSNIQLLIITTLVFGYLAWALNYHRLDKSLNLDVMLEYILTALLVLIIFYGILV
jgi:hypothetical protein